VYREGGQIPIGYRIGGSAICAWALIETPGYAQSKEARAAVERAVDFVVDALDDPKMSADFNGSYDVRGWGHTYALNLFLRFARDQARARGQGEGDRRMDPEARRRAAAHRDRRERRLELRAR
jgi:hypothetical protein